MRIVCMCLTIIFLNLYHFKLPNAMISRTILRLRSPTITSLNSVRHLSSAAARNATTDFAAAAAPDDRKTARPSTVTWSPQLHNSVSLIGTVEYPLKQYKNNRLGVHTRLCVNSTGDSNALLWVTIEMWDELAERALLHLKQNDYVYISGELGSFTSIASEGTEMLRHKVTAKELNYVRVDEPGKNSQRAVNSEIEAGESGLQKHNDRLHLWQIYFANPDEWYDNRKNKKNSKHPDFKHKSTGEVLWLSQSDPPWVKKQVELLDSRLSRGQNNDVTFKFSASSCLSDELLMVPNSSMSEEELFKPGEPQKNFQRVMNPGKETGESTLQKKNNRLQLWKEFSVNRDEWYDNRNNKKNPKQPDFKHKSTGEVLWLSESDPPWVRKEVELLDSRLSVGQNDDVTSKLSPPSCVSDELLMVPNPTVTAEELIKPGEPEKSFQRVVNSGIETGKGPVYSESTLQKKNKRLQLWIEFSANPEEWYDNRKNKKNPKQPDFKHKSTGEALWLSESDPPWVKKEVELLDSGLSAGQNNDATSKFSPSSCMSDELLMVPNPIVTEEELIYVKPGETEKNFQGVVNRGKETGESTLQKKSDRLQLWKELSANPDEWYDNRKGKKNPKQPDFKHKSSGEALWLGGFDPPWVRKQVELFDSRLSRGATTDVTSKSSPSKWVSDELLEELNPTVTTEEVNNAKQDEPGKNVETAMSSENKTREHLGESTLQRNSYQLRLWKELFGNPNEWYDNRKCKKNPRQPDFKHKRSGEVLWLDGRDPWVKKQVELLDSKRST